MEKQNAKKVSVIIAVVVLFIAIGIIVTALMVKKAKSNPKVSQTAVVQEEPVKQEPEKKEPAPAKEEPSNLMTADQKSKLEKDIEKAKMQLSMDSDPRFEKMSYEKADDSFSKSLFSKLEKLYEELYGDDDDDDDPFSDYSNGNLEEKESKGGAGLGDNKTLSDKLATDSAVRICFDYGSYLNTKDIYMASYLKGSQRIMTSADVEYAEFYLALDELLNSIPKNKRKKCVFAVIGYADSSFRNGVPDKGPESREFNTELSLKRSESVINMLINEKKIAPNRILPAEGRGFDNLIMENGKENHEKSRRVEVFAYAK